MIADLKALPSLERTTLDGPIQVLQSSNQMTRQTSQGMMFVGKEVGFKLGGENEASRPLNSRR